jgi:arylsulfatase
MNTWPDAGNTPFRNEKNSSWEGAYRVPCMVRFPGRSAGSVSNEIVSSPGLVPDHPGRPASPTSPRS